MKLTPVLNHITEKLSSSVTHNVLWRAMVFEPLCHQVLSYRGTLLIVDETGRLELAAVLLEIDNKDALMADSCRGCYS